ncbi:MAG: hypothetical protein QRY74_05330 [Chlamydia sp.]
MSLVDYLDNPVPFLHGSVSVISRSWVESAAVMSDGNEIDPYQLGYGYSSSSLEKGSLADGWEFFHPSEVAVIEPFSVETKDTKQVYKRQKKILDIS